MIEKAQNENQERLSQSQYNTNVAFYVHLKTFNNSVRTELEKRLEEVFFFTRGIDWKFDSFGIEKAGSRRTDILGYFIFRGVEVEKLKKIFIQEFSDYDNVEKITFSVSRYEKVSEEFFDLEL